MSKSKARNLFLHSKNLFKNSSRNYSTILEEPKLTPRLAKLQTSETLPFSDFLTDSFGRQHTYLRISLTEKCNLR